MKIQFLGFLPLILGYVWLTIMAKGDKYPSIYAVWVSINIVLFSVFSIVGLGWALSAFN